MSLETKLIALAQAIGNDIKAVNGKIGDLTSLPTTAKNSVVASIIELYGLLGSAGAVIDDEAGAGATSVTWSADKSLATIETAVAQLRNELVDGAGAALDTFKELQDALGNDPTFSATIATAMGNRIRVDEAQTFSAAQKLQACTNIGVGDPEHDLVAEYNAAKA